MSCNSVHPDTGLTCTLDDPLHSGDCQHIVTDSKGRHMWSVRWTRRWVGDYLEQPDEAELLPI